MHSVRIGIKVVTLACVAGPRKNGERVSLSRARSFLRPLLPSACYAGYVTREFTLLQKKTEVLIVRIKNCERVSLKVNFVISLEAYDIILLAELVYQ